MTTSDFFGDKFYCWELGHVMHWEFLSPGGLQLALTSAAFFACSTKLSMYTVNAEHCVTAAVIKM